MNLTIGEIAKACGGQLYTVTEDTCVEGVVLDSRKIGPGMVFVATEGARVDGHRFIPQVFQAGASLVITQKTPEQVKAQCGVSGPWGSYILVEDSFAALKKIAAAYRSKLSIPIVGITGSVGKTSTKEFIAGVLSQRFKVLKTEGNFNNEVGVPLTLLQIGKEHEAAVVEMGISDFGEMHRLSEMVRPTVCVITNIGQCHLENLKSREGILKAKTEIFDFMAQDAEICLNGEDDMLRTIRQVRGSRPSFFGLGGWEEETVYADHIVEKGLWGSEAVLHIAPDCSFTVQVPLPGKHMVINAAAAACVGYKLGLTAEEIAKGISSVQPVGGRNNLLRLEKYTVIDDCYNANPVSMEAALDLLSMADTEKIAILGDMFELGENSPRMHEQIGIYAVRSRVDRLFCVGENSRRMFEAAQATAESRTDGGTKTEASYFGSTEEFLKALRLEGEQMLPENSTILVKASHSMNFTKIVEALQQGYEK